MFDTETARLISSASPLDGLDLGRLPQFLTEAYAQVVAARLAAVGAAAGQLDKHWQDTALRLRRLAETYEGLAIFLPSDNNHRRACAFVAGSAHYTLDQARRLQANAAGKAPDHASLSVHSVGSEVAACLLFLIAGHQADAAESSKTFSARGGHDVRSQLLDGIAALASGDGSQLSDFASTALVGQAQGDTDYLERAADALWRRLAMGVQLVARRGLGRAAGDPLPVIDSVALSVAQAQAPINLGLTRAQLRLPIEGPYHLSKLLRPAAEALLDVVAAATPAPGGVAPEGWASFLRYFAGRRPFLWQNHAEAIRRGFLQPGQSFALTFPTGAGKTTMTELRIAAELLRDRRVVYLAPTNALVDQVSNELKETLRPIAPDVVRGRFLEDFGEPAGTQVYVQTPEQCLAYLAHEPTGHADVGLLVVDECHQLSAEHATTAAAPRLPGRRAVDAMWTVLSILHRSPEADVVLISAMVRNGDVLARWLQAATSRAATVLDLAWKPTRQVRGIVAYDHAEIAILESTLATRRKGAWKRSPAARDGKGLVAKPVGLFCHTQVWNTTSSFAKFPLLSETVPLGVNRYWSLTANRNEVGGRLLAAMAHAGMRPIVFSQRIDWTSLIAKEGANDLRTRGSPEVALSAREDALFAAAAEELGGDHLVERPIDHRVGVHHGLLLLSERLAMESAFRRDDGLRALVATPTVAQGINLSAEAVIIAGDDRWQGDGTEGAPETLAVHELLNAAGRAGRAGHFAHGIVIDLPGRVFTVRGTSSITFDGLSHAMSLFGLPDQCLDVVDPLTQVIDRIAQAGAIDDVGQYLVRRCAGLDEAVLVNILRSTLGNALREERDVLAATQATLLREAARALDAEDTDTDEWRELAAQTGTAPFAVAAVAAALPDSHVVMAWSFRELLDFALNLLQDSPGMLFGLVDPASSNLARIIPRLTKQNEEPAEWERRWQAALREVLPTWLGGGPINLIGEALHRHRSANRRVKALQLGRRFALQTSSGLGHGVSLVCRVAERKVREATRPHLAAWLRLLQGCVREGFDDPDKLLLFWQFRRHPGIYPRVVVHRRFHGLAGLLPPWTDLSDIDGRRKLIRRLTAEEAS